ncbi:hypothetical protein CDV26_08210 [Francisella halioticida]|uniref:HTH lysR-type domain-containing protein n=1 Tax=Francisella halioticida TaxID=549298 RepID=A0ABN5B1F8_9GAMM|nr:LysR family transcriptional regulator [Francisella halioticida]ASG68373.1 hypothetical protein CDV26_08210 [Francisella halioticida]
MLNIEDLLFFIEVVDAGTFYLAARRLKVSIGTVSNRLTRLENSLKVKLVKVSTRGLAITDEGVFLYEKTVL